MLTNNNNIILETESIITKYINMRNSCLNKSKGSARRSLFGKPSKKLTDKLFFENELSNQKLVNDFLNQFEVAEEKENQTMEECDSCNTSSCSSEFEKCSFSTSESSSNSSLCCQESCNILASISNNNLVKINNEFSNKCDAIRNLIKSSSTHSSKKQPLITGEYKFDYLIGLLLFIFVK